MAEIKLTKGKTAQVDDEDFGHLNQHKWFAARVDKTWYARRSVPHGPGENQYQITMHEHLLGKENGTEIDHIDGDGLNNKRNNLRRCTHQQNLMNRRGFGKTSKYKGVSKRKDMRKYRSSIELNGKPKHLGYFYSEEEAALAYNCAAKELFGSFAKLNEVVVT